MGFKATIKSEQDLAILLVWGEITMELLYDILHEMTDVRPNDVLFVYRDAIEVDLPTDALKAYGTSANKTLEGRSNMRTCVVVEDPLLFGLTRLFGAHSEFDSDPGFIQYLTCKSIEDAAVWLERDLDELLLEVELLDDFKQQSK